MPVSHRRTQCLAASRVGRKKNKREQEETEKRQMSGRDMSRCHALPPLPISVHTLYPFPLRVRHADGRLRCARKALLSVSKADAARGFFVFCIFFLTKARRGGGGCGYRVPGREARWLTWPFPLWPRWPFLASPPIHPEPMAAG
ncbi:hypothetical protein LY76DRAFT_146079 [Colletotrichum caudatum]|nr:hypothetical protein LY76DRAFT_146079 [Colletotrichum caudatum]